MRISLKNKRINLHSARIHGGMLFKARKGDDTNVKQLATMLGKMYEKEQPMTKKLTGRKFML